MFIKSVGQGGYRGDVNEAYRFGRRQAYDDYIDGYNKALKADVDTYNFNQAMVRDTANNYNLAVGMDKTAQNQAIDFVNNNNKLSNAVQGAEIDFYKREAIAPNVEGIGTNQAKIFTHDTASKANQSAYNFGMSETNLGNLATHQATATQDAQNKLTSAQNTGLTNEQKMEVLKSNPEFAKWWSADNQAKVMADFHKQVLEQARAMPENKGKTDDQILTEYKANADVYNDKVKEYITQRWNMVLHQRSALTGGNGVNVQTGQLAPTQGAKTTQQKATATKEPKAEKPPEFKDADANATALATQQIGDNMYRIPGTNQVYIVGMNGKQKVAKVATVSDAWLQQQMQAWDEKQKAEQKANGNNVTTTNGVKRPNNEE